MYDVIGIAVGTCKSEDRERGQNDLLEELYSGFSFSNVSRSALVG